MIKVKNIKNTPSFPDNLSHLDRARILKNITKSELKKLMEYENEINYVKQIKIER